jgi:hypothetical protein
VDLVTLVVVGTLAVAVLGGVGSMIVPDAVNRLRRIWALLSPPPM